jgi:hypothetical protein
MVGVERIERSTLCLKGRCSTTELHTHIKRESYNIIQIWQNISRCYTPITSTGGTMPTFRLYFRGKATSKQNNWEKRLQNSGLSIVPQPDPNNTYVLGSEGDMRKFREKNQDIIYDILDFENPFDGKTPRRNQIRYIRIFNP